MEDKNKLSREVKTKNMDTKPETDLNTKDFQKPESTGKVSGSTNIEKPILVYDLTLVPEDMTLEEVIDKYKKEGVLLYSTVKNINGKPPYTINL